MVIIADYNKCNELNIADQYKKWFSFELSPFQKWSINALINGNHSLITAHTGSGKTVPAEFGIQYFTSLGKKVIYTTPIKALSNQKLHDFRRKYPHISFGILTGDIEDNREAQVLIMTTEILANTLMSNYTEKNISLNINNSSNQNTLRFEMDFENELALVVFDEVHYIADQDRGHAWEQSIILLPKQVQLLMLSATISEPENFAKWVETKNMNISENEISKYVVLSSTNERIVPLKHYAWFAPFKSKDEQSISSNKQVFQLINNYSNKLITLRNGDLQFQETNYANILKLKNYIDLNKYQYFTNFFTLTHVIEYCKKHKMLPALCFLFSRKQVEEIAKTLVNSGKINLFDEDDEITSTKIQKECRHILSTKLSNYQEYINLPEYSVILSLLEKGVGIHHAGVLPILRELIEILDEKGYIKLLFATETFAVGVNMPTKTVIFTNLKKYSNSGFRYLHPFEYTQMAGRAGRRGLDTVGNVIHLCNLFDLPSTTEMCKILTGKPQTIKSQFHVSYHLILNSIYKSNNLLQDNNELNSKNIVLSLLNEFCSKSLIQPELNYQFISLTNKQNELQLSINKLKEEINLPLNILIEYAELLDKLSYIAPKHKKNINKEIENLLQNYSTLKQEFEIYSKIKEHEKLLYDYNIQITQTKEFFINEINNCISLLIENKFLELNENDKYILTKKGIYAMSVQEAHLLAFSEILEKYNYFKSEGFSSNEERSILFCSFLSLFSTISIPEDYRLYPSDITNKLLSSISKDIYESYEKYYLYEEQKFGYHITQEFKLTFDICEPIIQWCKASSNQECQYILEDLKQYDIFTGEYIKAILKIVKMCKELEKAAEYYEDFEFLSILKSVPHYLLKYVATNQSLYV
jgi:antiviral helicase SKI2